MFKNPFSFSGRIRRTEYGLSYLIYVAVLFTFIWATEGTGTIGSFIYVGVYLGLLWFLLAQGAKRCHDLGNSGFYLLIPFYVLYMLFADGKNGTNSYGPNPKAPNENDEINQIGKPMNNM